MLNNEKARSGMPARSHNVRLIEGRFRVFAGVVLIAWALGAYPGYHSNWGWLGLVPLLTGMVGYCPV